MIYRNPFGHKLIINIRNVDSDLSNFVRSSNKSSIKSKMSICEQNETFSMRSHCQQIFRWSKMNKNDQERIVVVVCILKKKKYIKQII